MNISQAEKRGTQAQHDGLDAAPALNSEFINEACDSDTDTSELLKAYNYGYTKALLS